MDHGAVRGDDLNLGGRLVHYGAFGNGMDARLWNESCGGLHELIVSPLESEI